MQLRHRNLPCLVGYAANDEVHNPQPQNPDGGPEPGAFSADEPALYLMVCMQPNEVHAFIPLVARHTLTTGLRCVPSFVWQQTRQHSRVFFTTY